MRIKTLFTLTAMFAIVAAGPAYSDSEPIGPALTISGMAEPTAVNATRTAQFTWTVSNQTAVAHKQAKLLSVLKVGWAAAAGTDPRCTADTAAPYVVGCDLGELAPDARTTVVIRATVAADAQLGAQEISASAFSEHTPADAGAPSATVTVTVERAPCMCTKEYNPVVGVDGKTYANPCMAKCAGVEVKPNVPGGVPLPTPDPYDTSAPVEPDPYETPAPTEPEPEPCVCTKEYNPVVGVDGKTYANPCMAKCAGVEVKPNVPGGCVPPASFAPPPVKPGDGWFYQLTMGSKPPYLPGPAQSASCLPLGDDCQRGAVRLLGYR